MVTTLKNIRFKLDHYRGQPENLPTLLRKYERLKKWFGSSIGDENFFCISNIIAFEQDEEDSFLEFSAWCLNATGWNEKGQVDVRNIIRELSAQLARTILFLFEIRFPNDLRPQNAINAAIAHAKNQILHVQRQEFASQAWKCYNSIQTTPYLREINSNHYPEIAALSAAKSCSGFSDWNLCSTVETISGYINKFAKADVNKYEWLLNDKSAVFNTYFSK